MSAFNEIDATCVDCAEDFRATVWTAIHAKEDPELKDLMQGGRTQPADLPAMRPFIFL